MTRTLYHGTSLDRQAGIEARGILAFQKSGCVFLTDSLQRAREYAASRAFGMYASSQSRDLVGSIVTADVPAELIASAACWSDVRVTGNLPRGLITSLDRFDVTRLYGDPRYRWRRLREFAGLLDWEHDDLVDRPDGWEEMLRMVEDAEAVAREEFHRLTGHWLDPIRDCFPAAGERGTPPAQGMHLEGNDTVAAEGVLPDSGAGTTRRTNGEDSGRRVVSSERRRRNLQ